MTSNYMLDVVVEIAFDSGYTTPDASRTWTDVSQYVELAQFAGITFGRQDERATADANDLTLVLDNSDGRFTAGRAASPYYPNVKIGRPIRVTATPPGGTASTRFVGFINEWPVEWNGSDAYARATVRATSRLSRLGFRAKLRSMLENEILQDRPSQYYTLGDPQDSTAASDTSGTNAARLLVAGTGSPLTFGSATGPGFDGLTAVQLAGGQYLNYDGSSTLATGTGGTAQSVSCFMLRSGAPPAAETVVSTYRRSSPTLGFSVRVLPSGVVEVKTASVVTMTVELTGSTNVCDGSTHHIAVTRAGGTWTLYVDGVVDATTATAIDTSITSWIPVVGDPSIGPDGDPEATLTGTVAHAAFWPDKTLTAARVAAQAATGLTGAVGERTDERLTRILGWAGVAMSEISTQTGDATMTYQETSGQSVVDALREVESTEGGVLFDGADGRVTFHNRSHRYTAAVAATFDMAAQQVEADYAPRLDRSTLANDVTAENPVRDESTRQTDEDSREEYGDATASVKVIAESYDPLVQHAAWLVASYAEPRPRVPSLTVDVLAQVGGTPSAGDILALTIGSRIKVTNQPTQADTTDADYFVEGYTETIGPESYRITFNLSPAHPSLSVFVLDDPVRGQLDGGYVLGL